MYFFRFRSFGNSDIIIRMKNFAGVIFILIFFTFVLSGCNSLGRQENDPDDDIREYGNQSETESVKLPDGWTYETEITNEGSRSEGSVNHLFFRYKEIPAVFNRIIIGGSVFEYRPLVHIWDNSGYIRTASACKIVISDEDMITADELKQGWYESDNCILKMGTPPAWIHVEAGKLEAFVSPDKFSELTAFYSLSSLENSGMLMLAPVNSDE